MMNQARATWVVLASVTVLASACAEDAGAPENFAEQAAFGQVTSEASVPGERDLVDGDHADHRHHSSVVLVTPEAIAEVFDEESNLARLEYPDAFRQAGWMMEAESLAGMEYRVERADGSFSKWEPVEVYWNEGRLFNARVRLSEPTHVMELRGFEDVSFAEIEFFEEVVAPEQIQRAGQTEPPTGESNGVIGTRRQMVAPRSLVIPRAEWGAINPGKICGSVVAPYRASVHHTYIPSNDGPDASARVRQMQDFHVNTRGWCDIGYHFIVSQAGDIYQGRSRSDRPGAHVGNQNSGNVGISFIADFTTQTPSQTQLNAGARMLKWIHETHGVSLTRTAVKGHREWPGQGTTCPGGNMISSLDTLLQMTRDLVNPPEPENFDVAIDVDIKGGDTLVDQGSSAQVADALPGATVTAEIILTNAGSSSVIRGVRLGYAFDELGLTPLSYTIESDHPAYDQSSWTANDAMQADGNPAAGDLGQSGELIMNAFSAGESKRVVVELRADDYSFGLAPFGGARAWVSHIDGVYAQSGFGGSPSTNRVGSRLRAHAGLDIFDRDAWFFEGPEDPDVEGWTAEGIEAFDQFRLNTGHGLLAMHMIGEGAYVVSPAWTAIDADGFSELVLRARSHDGEHVKAVYWAREGEEFSEERRVRFAAPGDGEYHDLVVDLSEHPEWSGQVKALRIDLLAAGAPGEDASGWYDVDHIYLQDRAGDRTSASYGPVIDEAPVALLGEGAEGPGVDGLYPVDDQGGRVPGLGANPGENGRNVRTASGCATTGQQGSGTPLAALGMVLGWMLATRRRRAA